MPNSSRYLRLGRAICGDLPQSERREWWLASGNGSYAAGTVAGTLTRAYHGLLIAPVAPGFRRYLLLAKADATLCIGKERHALFTNRWQGGVVDPHGYLLIESFALEGNLPVWRFSTGGAVLEQRIWMEPGSSTSHLAFRLTGVRDGIPEPASIELRLLANVRDHHSRTLAGNLPLRLEYGSRHVSVVHPELAFTVSAPGGSIEPDDTWIERFELARERERGFADPDNHLLIATVTLHLVPGQWHGIRASVGTEPVDEAPGTALERFRDFQERTVSRDLVQNAALRDAPPWVRQVVLSARDYVIDKALGDGKRRRTVIAGYPWFNDWGRDTMIALPGLTLTCGRPGEALAILKGYGGYLSAGLLPNTFPDAGERALYNAVDAPLWYIEAWRRYVAVTNDLDSLRDAFSSLAGIAEHYLQGTRFGISVDPADGLLRAGESGVQLTWMDARVGERVVTPREGKPVEVNALWYNALLGLRWFAQLLNRDGLTFQRAADRAGNGFQRFVDRRTGALFDVIDGPGGQDTSIRPNQIFAASLPYSPIDAATVTAVTDQCRDHLLTSYGLRSLSPRDPRYCGTYAGGVASRDGCYHQGPVWAWLLGHYAIAEYRAYGDPRAARQRLEVISDHLADAGLGKVSELFDGDPPHLPRGCPSQAWSLACILDAWVSLRRIETKSHDSAPYHA